jgi:Trk-type K+ transport system membrane component
MMYVSVFPVAMSMRVSGSDGDSDYNNTSIAKYSLFEADDSLPPAAYLASHLRNQLGFDLWYIFLGTFCICIAEAAPIADTSNIAFNVFAVLFEVVSAYGNVGLSLGTNATLTSLSGDFTVFSKLVICLMMLRGRHRGLPSVVDRAVRLPEEEVYGDVEDL